MNRDVIRRALVGRGSVYVGGRLSIIVVQIVALPIVTRVLEPADYGEVALALIVSSVVVALFDGGLPTASQRIFFDDDGLDKVRTLVGLTAMVGTVAIAAVDFLGPQWVRVFDEVRYEAILRIGVWTAVPAMVRNATLAILRAQDRAVAHSVVALTGAAGGQILGLVLLVAVDWGPEGYVGGIGVGAIVAAGIGWVHVGARVPLRLRGLGLRETLGFSLPTVPRNASTSLLNNGDRILIERVVGLDAVGRYQVAYRVGSLPMLVIGELARSLVPILFRTDLEGRSAFGAARPLIVRLSSAMALGAAITGPVVLIWMVPASYQPEALALTVATVAASGIPYAFVMVASLGLIRLKRTGAMARVTATAAILNLVLVGLLAASIGVVGAAVATLIAFTVEAVLLHRAVVARGLGFDRDGAVGVGLVTVAGCLLAGLLPFTWVGSAVRLVALAGVAWWIGHLLVPARSVQ